MNRFLALSLFAALTACSSPRQECIAAASEDLKVVQSLIADTEETLARGYAIQTETRSVLYTDFCLGTGIGNGGFQFCNRTQPVTTETPVAVDLNEERRKLKSLQRKEAELQVRTARDLRRCNLTHPAG